jgi:hypothetical protein
MRTLILLLAAALAPGIAQAETTRPDADHLRETVAALAAPELAGRAAGSPGEREAARLIAGWFAAAGLQPAAGDGYLQPVPLAADTSVNVLASWPGRGDLATRWIVLGAHLDHLGRVDAGEPGLPGPGAYYPGAGDNASGVAVVRAVAEALAADEGSRPARSVLVCAFGAEEIGLVGSRHLVADPPVPRDRVDAMVNLDAVGRLGEGPLHVAGAATCAPCTSLLSAAADGAAPVMEHAGASFGSDHLAFLEAGVPALFLFTSAYPEMNSPADSLAAVDLPGLRTVARITATLVDSLRHVRADLGFVAPVPVSRSAGGNRATWFGTAPDFGGATADGYLIGAVTPGGPADRAGLRAGDVVVALGASAVTGLAGFTTALRMHDPGDTVEVTVLRDGRRLDYLVTLGDRRDRVE